MGARAVDCVREARAASRGFEPLRGYRAARPVRVPRSHLRGAAVEAAQQLLDQLLVVIVLGEGVALGVAEGEGLAEHGVVVVRAVLSTMGLEPRTVRGQSG